MANKEASPPSNLEILQRLVSSLHLGFTEFEAIKRELIVDGQRIRTAVQGLESQYGISTEKATSAVLSSAPPRSIASILSPYLREQKPELSNVFRGIPGWSRKPTVKRANLTIVQIGVSSDTIMTRIADTPTNFEIYSLDASEGTRIGEVFKSLFIDLVVVHETERGTNIVKRVLKNEPFAHCLRVVGGKRLPVSHRRVTDISSSLDRPSLCKAVLSASIGTRTEAADVIVSRMTQSRRSDRTNAPRRLRTLPGVVRYHSSLCRQLNSSAVDSYSLLRASLGNDIFYQGLAAHWRDMSSKTVEEVGAYFPHLAKDILVCYGHDKRRFAFEGDKVFTSLTTIDKMPRAFAMRSHIEGIAEFYHQHPFLPDEI